jgi:hypothetical protein
VQDPGLAADTRRFLNDVVNSAGPNPTGGNDGGVVPEPTSLVLLGGAAAALWFRRR